MKVKNRKKKKRREGEEREREGDFIGGQDIMSCGGRGGGGSGRVDGDRWSCGKTGGVAVNLLRVSSIVRDIGEPCLSQSPIKVSVVVSVSSYQNLNVYSFLLFDFHFAITA